jgi:hypothetical protein
MKSRTIRMEKLTVDIPFLEQVKAQAQVLVPLIKTLRVELGEERANDLVRQALGDWAYKAGSKSVRGALGARRNGWRRNCCRSRPSATRWIMRPSSRHRTRTTSTSLGVATPSFIRNWEYRSWDFYSCARRTFRWPQA